MEAVRRSAVIGENGELVVRDLPFRKGQHIEIIVLAEPDRQAESRALTATALLESGLVGLWKDRGDIGDAATYARQLREQAQHRWG
jgi:hypothetical protein